MVMVGANKGLSGAQEAKSRKQQRGIAAADAAKQETQNDLARQNNQIMGDLRDHFKGGGGGGGGSGKTR